MKKSVISLLFAGTLCISMLAGCGKSNDSVSTGSAEESTKVSSEDSTKEELVFVNFRDIRDLNPHLFGGEMYAQELIFETLIAMNDEGGFEGCLADSWEISEDGKVYTFHIRPEVHFTDGLLCDANAIKANFDAIIDNKSRHVWTWMNFMVGVSAPDADTFVIELTEPYYPLLTELAVTRPFAIISPNCMKDGKTKDGVNGFIGTGPYVLADFVTDEYATFEVNKTYWDEKPEIKKITAKVIEDNQTRLLALEKGEIDIIYGKNMIDADAVLKFQKNDKFKVELSNPASTRMLLLNTTDEILSDLTVRQALQHTVNKAAISKGVFYDIEQPADTLYAPTMPYCDVKLEPYKYDVEVAASLLDQAGWILGEDGVRKKDGKNMELELLYNADSVTEKTISEFLQSELETLGVTLNITGQEEQSYRDNMKAGNFDIVFNIAWGTPYDPQSSLAAMREPCYGDYAAQQGLDNKAEIDQAITKVLTTTTEEERQELYNYILTSFHDAAVYIPLTYECNKTIYRSDLKGVHFPVSQYIIPFWDMSF